MDQPSEHDAPPPAAQPADSEALRGTRFEFGGRRPYSFAPPRVAERTAGRPLPGIGTVAIGHVSRMVPYGAFVDFLGFRGMIHISQLQPGQRVERVEDVVQLQDEVQVRVIGVDPERRHINLVLVVKVGAGGERGAASEQRASVSATTTAASVASVASVAAGAATIQDSNAAATVERTASAEGAPEPSDTTTPLPVPTIAAGAQPQVVPKARPAPAPRSAQRPMAGPTAKPAGPLEPKAAAKPAVAQHGARAIRRELADPRHPMSRLLASAGQARTRAADNERARQEAELAPLGRPAPVAPEPTRPVHVFGPDPEPEQDEPATLEALAARFGQRRDTPSAKPSQPKTAAERSRQEREKQAQILARLREDAAKFAK